MLGISRWQCDSRFNSIEIRELGVGDDKRGVVPPFNRVDEAFRETHDATYGLARPFVAMFVGRRVPNKGHVHILRTLAAWRELFPETELRCRIIGSVDAQLSSYYDELAALESMLDLGGSVEWREHVSEAALAETFRSSHVYLNLSEHEGFCVPLIEAQAVGLPTISAGATANIETAGPGQIVVPVPRSGSDYDLVAGLLHEVCVSWKLRRALVQAGCRNAFQRFTSQMVESQFLADMEPVLRTLEA